MTELDPEPRCIVESGVAGWSAITAASEEFLSLKKKTQRDYGRMLDIFAPIDYHPADSVHRRHVRELRKTFAGKRRIQKLFRKVASALFNFAVDNDYVEINPATRILCWPAQGIEGMDGVECAASKRPTRHGTS